jgi:hypothetical protein
MKKLCTKCKSEKYVSEFHSDKQKKDGKYPICKECIKSRCFEPDYTKFKICPSCKLKKSHKNFRRCKGRNDGLQIYCKQCQDCNELSHRYGISKEQYLELIIVQDNKCAICGKSPDKKRFAIDHDHETGIVRGLLCITCNVELGYFFDNKNLLLNAIQYLGGN